MAIADGGMTEEQLLAKMRELVIRMHLADDNDGIGMGCYLIKNEWRAAYEELRALVGMPPQTIING